MYCVHHTTHLNQEVLNSQFPWGLREGIGSCRMCCCWPQCGALAARTQALSFQVASWPLSLACSLCGRFHAACVGASSWTAAVSSEDVPHRKGPRCGAGRPLGLVTALFLKNILNSGAKQVVLARKIIKLNEVLLLKLYFFTALLRSNSQTMQYTHLKCTDSVVYSIFIDLWCYHHNFKTPLAL